MMQQSAHPGIAFAIQLLCQNFGQVIKMPGQGVFTDAQRLQQKAQPADVILPQVIGFQQ